jgi:hypothetical protein
MFESGFGLLAYLLFAFLILGIASFIKYLSTPTPRPSEREGQSHKSDNTDRAVEDRIV